MKFPHNLKFKKNLLKKTTLLRVESVGCGYWFCHVSDQISFSNIEPLNFSILSSSRYNNNNIAFFPKQVGVG